MLTRFQQIPVFLIVVVALATAPDSRTTASVVTAPESGPGLLLIDPDCLLQGPTTSGTGDVANRPQLDLAQTTSSTSGNQTPPPGKPNCDGCTVDWGVKITWAHTGSAATQFGNTTNPIGVVAGQTTGWHTTDDPLQIECGEDEEFRAYKTDTPQANTTATYTCQTCQ